MFETVGSGDNKSMEHKVSIYSNPTYSVIICTCGWMESPGGEGHEDEAFDLAKRHIHEN